MAKTDPKKLKQEGEELKALFAKIKKKPHNCAILMAKDGVVIEAHIKKSPEILVKLAKKNGGSAKGAWGTITMDGQVLKLDPVNDKVPGNLPKICKTYFAARGLKNRLEILEPDVGNSTQVDTSDDPLAAVDDAVDAQQAACATLEKQLKDLMPKIQPILDDARVTKAEGEAMKRALASFKTAIEKIDPKAAEQQIAQVKTIIEDYKKWADERANYDKTQKKAAEDKLKALMPQIKPVLDDAKVKQSEGAAMTLNLKDFKAALEDKDWQKAEKALTAIAQILKDYAKTKSPDGDRAKFDKLKAEMEKIKASFAKQPEPLKKALADSSSTVAIDVNTSIGSFERYLADGKLDAAELTLDALQRILGEARDDLRILDSTKKEAMALKDPYNEAQNHPKMASAKDVIKSFEEVMNATDSKTAIKHLNDLKAYIKLFTGELSKNKANDTILQGKLSKLETKLANLKPRIEAAKKYPFLYTQSEVLKWHTESLNALDVDDLAKATDAIKKLEIALEAFEKELASKQSADGDDRKKQQMARWLERNKADINMVLKDKKSKHNGDLTKWLTAYRKHSKAGKLDEAQQALDEVALVLKAYAKDFKLSDKQREQILKNVDDIKKKMLEEVDKLVKESA